MYLQLLKLKHIKYSEMSNICESYSKIQAKHVDYDRNMCYVFILLDDFSEFWISYYFSIYFVRIVYPCGLIEKRLVQCAGHRSTLNLPCGKTDQPASTYSGTESTTSLKPLVVGQIPLVRICQQQRKTGPLSDTTQ